MAHANRFFFLSFLLKSFYCLQGGQRDFQLVKEIGLLIILSSRFLLNLPMLVMVRFSYCISFNSRRVYNSLIRSCVD